jgi:DNA-binding winged helix-turn-helix (wHTH) protein
VPAGARFVFEPFELDAARRRLTSGGEPLAVTDRQLDVLLMLVARAGQIIGKDDLVQAGWKDVAVSDNSLEQVISSLRRLLGPQHIETVPRRGYRFGVPVARKTSRESDAALDALLAPHRGFVEGRAALESLERGQVNRARDVFEAAVQSVPEHASAHIGLANACVMQFEMTRADTTPDAAALVLAGEHAREACRLDAQSAEAWATLGFVLDRSGHRLDALAASKRAVSLEPDNWRHHFRLAFVGWGQERLHAAHRTLALLPGFPLAHWLAASVYVARQLLPEAERELTAALASPAPAAETETRFSSVALHWLLGLILLERGEDDRALQEFERELASEHSGHLYSRECCANTWYAIGGLRLRHGQHRDAEAAFHEVIARVPAHPFAHAAVGGANALDASAARLSSREGPSRPPSIEMALAQAISVSRGSSHQEAARVVDEALVAAPAGSAGWLLPLEPMLMTRKHPDIWAAPLARVRNRAA